MLGTLCRLSFTPDTCVRQTALTFDRYGAPSLLVAKFVPGFAAIAGALAGVIGIGYLKFLLFDFLGAVLWGGIAISIGYQFLAEAKTALSSHFSRRPRVLTDSVVSAAVKRSRLQLL